MCTRAPTSHIAIENRLENRITTIIHASTTTGKRDRTKKLLLPFTMDVLSSADYP